MKTVLPLVLIAIVFTFTRCVTTAVTDDQVLIIYPDSGAYGINVLDTGNAINGGNDFSFSAKIPEKGSLVVRITKTSGGNWYVDQSSTSYWVISTYDPVTKSQTFSTSTVSQTSDVKIEIQSGTYQLEFYENDSSNPTFTYVLDV
jgi:hypothetical protein